MKQAIIIVLLISTLLAKNTFAQTDSQSSANQVMVDFLKAFFPAGGSPSGATASGSQTTPNQSISQRSGFVFYCQGNPEWGNVCSMGTAGCGPTSLAMIISSFGIKMTPPQVDATFRANGWRQCNDADSYTFSAVAGSWLPSLGFTIGKNLVYNKILNLKQAKEYLDQGYLIVGSSTDFPLVNARRPGTRTGHIFVVDNVDIASATVSIRDPNNCSYRNGNDERPENIIRSVSAFPWFFAIPLKK